MAEIEIGKFTLESLTTGMYNDPEIIYREYIQNAVDSFDSSVAQGLMNCDDCRIEIIVDSDRQEISIKDNGTGIQKELAQKTLLDIGNSSKKHYSNRGFRGIGRLGGLSYCEKLSFCTSAQSEPVKTLITFDCQKLKELLVPGVAADNNLQMVISAVTDVQVLSEQASAHYFIVKMEGIDDMSSLLDIDYVKDYISQVAPVPYRDRFYWGQEIKKALSGKGYSLGEYAIFLGKSFEALSQIYKPYKITFDVSTRSGINKDEIQGISYFDVKDNLGEVLAVGWYGELNFFGTIAEDNISGIRVRQGNILIGDNKTLSPYFIESRFNNWCIGELFIVSNDLIPNARRDGFENNKVWYTFLLLTVLYPKKLGQTEWHQDHVHPYAGFETSRLKKIGINDKEVIERWQKQRNTLANLQLLEGKENESKNRTTLIDWCNKGNSVAYLEDDISKDIKDFDKFYESRKEKMLNALVELFNA